MPIVEGTDPDELKEGVGHYKGSYYPNENGQIVLSGHRDTVFRKIGELEIGDTLEIQLPYGEFSYEIAHTKIVDADDTSIITLQNDNEELVLTTCYPFSYIGNAPDRYIIYAKKLEKLISCRKRMNFLLHKKCQVPIKSVAWHLFFIIGSFLNTCCLKKGKILIDLFPYEISLYYEKRAAN